MSVKFLDVSVMLVMGRSTLMQKHSLTYIHIWMPSKNSWKDLARSYHVFALA